MSPDYRDKVLDWVEFQRRVAQLRADGLRVVLCHGAFDLLHAGHIDRLETARREGDVLVVTVTADGQDPDAPVHLPARLRAESLAALAATDLVSTAPAGEPLERILKHVQPDVMVPGLDAFDTHAEAASGLSAHAEEGATRVHVLHSSMFRQRIIDERRRPGASPSAVFLKEFKKRWSADQVIGALLSLRKTRVLVVGDTILDEYHFCRPYGMPLKSPIIAAESLGSELYAGGILAVANHVANFCDDVHLVTVLGGEESHEHFIREHLKPNVTPHLLTRPGAPTILKRRYVQKFLMRRLFEISRFDVRPLPAPVEAEVNATLEALLPDFDLVIVADFGHGTITPLLVETLVERSRFLALNTQLNSVNYGYHSVNAYPRADYVCIDEEESRLAALDRYGAIEAIVPALAERMDCSTMTVTLGHRGSMTWTDAAPPALVPVLSTEVIDTIGAGDAYLAISAPCVQAGFPPDLVGFIGNCVGALAVRIVGNQHSVEQAALFDFIRTTLR